MARAQWGKDYLNALHSAREKMNSIEVDRTKVKPVVLLSGYLRLSFPFHTKKITE